MIICSMSQLKSGTAVRKNFDASNGPVGPCTRPSGGVWSTNCGDKAAVASASSPVFQKLP